MSRRNAGVVLALTVALVTLLAAEVLATIQAKNFKGSLIVGDWTVCERDGAVCLVAARWARDKEFLKELQTTWYLSAPTVQNAGRKWLAVDTSGPEPQVILTDKKGDHTHWTFDVTERYSPRQIRTDDGQRLLKGYTGYRFRLQVAEGKYRGWFVAAEEAPQEDAKRPAKEPVFRKLKLVRSREEATFFGYIDTVYGPGG